MKRKTIDQCQQIPSSCNSSCKMTPNFKLWPSDQNLTDRGEPLGEQSQNKDQSNFCEAFKTAIEQNQIDCNQYHFSFNHSVDPGSELSLQALCTIHQQENQREALVKMRDYEQSNEAIKMTRPGHRAKIGSMSDQQKAGYIVLQPRIKKDRF